MARKTAKSRRRAPDRHFAEEAERIRMLVELQGDYLSLAKADGELVYVNAAYAALFGFPTDAFIGRNLLDFMPQDQREPVRRLIATLTVEQKAMSSRNQVRLPDGKTRWVHWTNLGFRDANGEAMLHSVGRDIQAQIETETRLRESEARFRLLAEASLDVVMALDRNLVRTYVSPASIEVFGYPPEELIGQLTGKTAHPEDTAQLQKGLRAMLDGEQERFVGVGRRLHRNGSWVWTETLYRAVRDPVKGEVSGIVASIRDITARKQVEEKLAQDNQRLEALAGQDGLTGLANRRIFDEALKKEYGRAGRKEERLCLLMIDVDHFKAFNDAYGHQAGDMALCKVAQAIRSCLRRVNDLAVRYGGEEFAVLSPGTPLEGGRKIAEKIRCAVRDLAFPHAGSAHGRVTVSIGVAAASKAEFLVNRERLVSCADAALYEAKRAGRDRVALAARSRYLRALGE